MHVHSNGQLNYVNRGTMRLMTLSSSWIVPQKRLVWIPPNHPHSVRCIGISRSWKTMLPKSFCERLPNEVCVLQSSPLLIATLEALPEHTDVISREKLTLLKGIIKLELRDAQKESFGVSLPLSSLLKPVCDILLEHPEDPRNIDDWAALVGVSRRTFTRLFTAETGNSFGNWKRMLVLDKALQLLGAGCTVNETSDQLGYSEPSAFVAAFRKRFGKTPGQFFKN